MNLSDSLNKLCKWRLILAGRWLGTRSQDDPECQSVRDAIDKLLLLRVEVSALIRCLLEAGLCTQEQLATVMVEEAQALDRMYEQQFPGMRTDLSGVVIYDPKLAAEIMRDWPP